MTVATPHADPRMAAASFLEAVINGSPWRRIAAHINPDNPEAHQTEPPDWLDAWRTEWAGLGGGEPLTPIVRYRDDRVCLVRWVVSDDLKLDQAPDGSIVADGEQWVMSLVNLLMRRHGQRWHVYDIGDDLDSVP